MPNLPLPKPASLGAPGLYSLPTANGCPSIVLRKGQLPVNVHFVLEDKTEVYIPMSDVALERLYAALKAHFTP